MAASAVYRSQILAEGSVDLAPTSSRRSDSCHACSASPWLQIPSSFHSNNYQELLFYQSGAYAFASTGEARASPIAGSDRTRRILVVDSVVSRQSYASSSPPTRVPCTGAEGALAAESDSGMADRGRESV